MTIVPTLCRVAADGRNKGAVVRAVLLQLLSDADAIYSAFHAALVTATTSDAFASLAAADGGGSDGALEAAAATGAGEGEGAAGGAAGQAPRAAAQRDLRAVAKELKRGLDVGVSAAMDRILQACFCMLEFLSTCCGVSSNVVICGVRGSRCMGGGCGPRQCVPTCEQTQVLYAAVRRFCVFVRAADSFEPWMWLPGSCIPMCCLCCCARQHDSTL